MHQTICALSGKKKCISEGNLDKFHVRFFSWGSLFRYGGTHLDLDFIMKKSISYLDSNYACAESDHSVGTGILNFDHTGFGHDLVEHILR